MELSRIERQYVDITLTATLRDGSPATIAGVDVAILGRRATPTGATVWTPTDYADGTATVLLAGPDADPDGALVVPTGERDLWVRIIDTPEVDTARIERINVT